MVKKIESQNWTIVYISSIGKVHNTLNFYIQNIYVQDLIAIFYFWYILYNWFGKYLYKIHYKNWS